MQALPPSPATGTHGRPQPSVAVVGEALVDCFADAERAGGAPFNLARARAAFRLDVAFVTRLGADDPDAATLRARARRSGLCESGFQDDDIRPTGVVPVIEAGCKHRFREQRGPAWEAIELALAGRQLRARAPAVLCVGTLAQRGDASRETVITLLRECASIPLLDVNLRPGHDDRSITERAPHLADGVKVNEDELGFLLVWLAPHCDPAAPRDGGDGISVQRLADSVGAGAVCAEPGPVPDDDEFFSAWRWTLGLHAPHRLAA